MSTFIKKIIQIDSINTIFYREFPCNYVFQGESHDFWEMLYMDSGQMTVIADNKSILLEKDSVIFHKPNEFHAIKTSSVIAPNAIVISFDSNSEIMKEFEDKIFYLTNENKNMLGKLLKEAKLINPSLGTFKKYPEDESESCSFQLVYNILEMLLINIYRDNSKDKFTNKEFKNNSKIDKHVIDSIVEYLDDNVYNRIRFDDVHKKFFYSKTQLKLKFKNQMGISIVAYFNKTKIEKAKSLIREGKYNFTQISSILSFDTVHYFSKVFKKITKMTPSEYERSVKSISEE